MTQYDGRLRADEWEVRPVSLPTASAIVKRHHYARGASKTAVYLHGLFPAGAVWEADCAGLAWWIPPTRAAAQATYPRDWRGVLALSRLCIVPETPKNACSFLLGRSMRLIDRHRWPCLVTYADEWQGHAGTIYLATNWQYVGMTEPQPTFVCDGRLLARKAGPKSRTTAEMAALGAVMVGRFAKKKFIHLATAGDMAAMEWR